jgi:GNAT superfamily N-acetyltransferase
VTAAFTWRTVRDHPAITLAVHRVERSVWVMFARHHYLSASINSSAQCFGGFIGEDLVAFSAYIHMPHPYAKNIKIGHRTVVLPDYQGLGISGHLAEYIGQSLYDQGFRYRRVIAHPAVIAYCSRSPRWREDKRVRSNAVRWHGSGSVANVTTIRKFVDVRTLNTRAFEYTPPRKG